MTLEITSTTRVSIEDLEVTKLKGIPGYLYKVKNRNLFISDVEDTAFTNIYEFDGEDLCETGCKAFINW